MDIGSLILPGQTGDTGRSPLPQQNARRQPQQPQVRIPQVIDLTEDDERSSNRPPFGPRDRQLPPMGFTSPQLLGHQQIIDVESYVPERHSSPPLQITGTTHNLTIAPFGRPGPSNPPPLPPYNSSLIWSGPPHLSTATRPLVNGRPVRLFADMNPESIRRQMMVQPSEYESWAPRMIQGFAREGLLAPHAPITLPRTMDYSSGGFPLYDEPPLGPPTGAHSVAPPQLPALETGFSRAPEEDEAAVCALCDQILCQGENPGERTLFILPKCGHVGEVGLSFTTAFANGNRSSVVAVLSRKPHLEP